jgi:hypothetical protein
LFVSFVSVIQTHFQPLVQHGVHTSIERELEENINFAFTTAIPADAPRFGQKALAEIAAVEDIISFLRVGLIPRLFGDVAGRSEIPINAWHACLAKRSDGGLYDFAEVGPPEGNDPPAFDEDCVIENPRVLAPEERGFLVGQQRLIGGLRIRRELGARVECKLFEGDCVRGVSVEPEYIDGLRTATGSTVEDKYMPRSLSHREAQYVMRQVEAEGWLSHPDIVRVDIAMPLYEIKDGAFTYAVVNVFYSQSGGFFKQTVTTSIFLSSFADIPNLSKVFDFIWFALIAKMMVEEARDIAHHIKAEKDLLRGFRKYFRFWEIVDQIVVCMGLLFVVMFSGERSHSSIMLAHVEADVASATQSESEIELVHNDSLATAQYMEYFKNMVVFYPFFIALRLLKAPRLERPCLPLCGFCSF